MAVEHPWLGISGQSVTPGVADTLGLSQRSCILVVEVVPGGPAAEAGLRATGSPSAEDDVITAIDGRSLTTVDALTQALDAHHVGDRVALTVVRGGKTMTVNVTLATSRTAEANSVSQPSPGTAAVESHCDAARRITPQ